MVGPHSGHREAPRGGALDASVAARPQPRPPSGRVTAVLSPQVWAGAHGVSSAHGLLMALDMRRPPPLHTLFVAVALQAAACTGDPPAPPELEQTEDSLRCLPVELVPTEADEHARPPVAVARTGANFCKDVEDLAAVVAHVEALEQLLEEGSDENQ